jgi:hypothetical protein
MHYQLPNGKVVILSVEEYLNMKDKDIQFLLSINAGEYVANPWAGSAINSKADADEIEEEDTETYFEEFFSDDFDIPEEPFEVE